MALLSGQNTLNAPSVWLSRKLPFHYVWVIVFSLATAQMIGLAVGWAAGVLVTPLQEEFSFEIDDIGLSFGLFYLAAAVFAPIAGWLGDRYGARRVMLLSAVLYVVTLLLVAFMDHLWSLYFSFGILRGIAQVIFMVPLMAGVALWFTRRLGLGTGVLWAASGIGSAVFAPLLPLMVGNLGWQNSFLLICAVLGASLLLLAIPLRNTPEEMGLKALRLDSRRRCAGAETEIHREDAPQGLQPACATHQGFLEPALHPRFGMRWARNHHAVRGAAGRG